MASPEAPTTSDVGALEGVFVLDLSVTAAARYCSRLFADCGARVVGRQGTLAEHEEQWLSLSKEILDGDPDVEQLRSLVATAHVVVEDEALPLRALGLEEYLRADAIRVTVTPCGLTGPYAHFQGPSPVVEAMSGLTWERGERGRPPLPLQTHLLDHAVGANAFTMAMVALVDARRSGLGQHVDVSALETMVLMNENLAVMFYWNGASPTRLWDTYNYGLGYLKCRDGWMYAFIGGGWETAVLALFNMPELLTDPRFATFAERVRHSEELRDELAPWFAEQSAADLFIRAQQLRLPFGWFAPPGGLVGFDHFAKREVFATVDGQTVPSAPLEPGKGVVVTPRPPQPAKAAPHRDEGDERASSSAERAARRPLEHLRIVDLTHYWAGPQVTRALADFGADVIRVESTRRIDPLRVFMAPPEYADDRAWERGFSAMVNYNKRSLTLDLTTERGQEILLDLVRDADLVVENFSPRVMRNFGLTYERLAAANPRLVLLSLSGFGQEGEWSDFPALGVTLEALSGAGALATYPGETRPHLVNSNVSDPVSGMVGAGLALAAIESARQSGVGAHVDLAELDVMMCLVGNEFLNSSTSPAQERFGVLPVAGDDQWIVVDRDTVTAETLRAAGVTVASDGAAFDALAGACREWEKNAAAEKLQTAGIAASAVLAAGEVPYNRHLRSRRFWTVVDHPVVGEYTVAGPMARMSRTPGEVRSPAPTLGQHNHEVLSQVGLDPAEIAALEAEGLIGTEPSPAIRIDAVPLTLWSSLGAMSEPDRDARERLVASINAEHQTDGQMQESQELRP